MIYAVPLFGPESSRAWSRKELEGELPGYTYYDADRRDQPAVEHIVAQHNYDIDLIIHTAAQRSPTGPLANR